MSSRVQTHVLKFEYLPQLLNNEGILKRYSLKRKIIFILILCIWVHGAQKRALSTLELEKVVRLHAGARN